MIFLRVRNKQENEQKLIERKKIAKFKTEMEKFCQKRNGNL